MVDGGLNLEFGVWDGLGWDMIPLLLKGMSDEKWNFNEVQEW